MRLRIATRSLITTAGAFDRAAIMADAWVLYRRWYRHDPARLTERLGIVLRQLWEDARRERADFIRREAERAAFRVAEERRRAFAVTPAGRALIEERKMLEFVDDWRHVARRTAEIDAALYGRAA